ncbi:N-(5'-phosphoribosyl)anthranilate isomerase [Roseovarius spongiae]|nr:N-(5'-phosphoribosyl)anthranilate isomerase [Roseovarius spongiae]
MRYPEHETWLYAVFASKAAIKGGVVRRAVRDVERLMGRRAFEAEVRRRGFHMVENAGQFIVFCNDEPVHVVC